MSFVTIYLLLGFLFQTVLFGLTLSTNEGKQAVQATPASQLFLSGLMNVVIWPVMLVVLLVMFATAGD